MPLKKISALLFICALLALCGGCSDEEPTVKVDLSVREEISAPKAPKALTYAYLPQYSHRVSYQRHHLLVEYLSREIGRPMRQVFPDTFGEHVRMVEQGEIDISFSNPFVYTRVAKTGARAFARIVEQSGGSDFRGQIIIRRDNQEIQTLKDCVGKRWIAVDPKSAGGYLFALALFHDFGVRKDDFAEIAFAPGTAGKQEKVILAVGAGNFDIGSIREGALETVRGKIDLDTIRVLAHTRYYPGWVFSAGRRVDPETVDALAQAMFELGMDNPEHAKILQAARFSKIIPAQDADYDSVRRLSSDLELE